MELSMVDKNEFICDRSSLILLDRSIEELVTSDDLARFIDVFVDKQDLKKLGFVTRRSMEGKTSYSANLMLKLVLYSYVCGVRTTRKIERRTYTDLPTIWLISKLHPDHNTINKFIRTNAAAIENIFMETVLFGLEKGFISNKIIAIDGTKIKAPVSPDKALHKKQLEEQIKKVFDKILEELDNDEIINPKIEGVESREDIENIIIEYLKSNEKLDEKIAPVLEKFSELSEKRELLENKGVKHLSLLDEDARMMKFPNGSIEFGANGQAAVDSDSNLITACDVFNAESDSGLMNEMISQVIENTGVVPETTVLDAGYCNSKELAEAEKKGYDVLVNIQANDSRKSGNIAPEFYKSKFVFDELTDTYTCPAGQILHRFGKKQKKKGNSYFYRYKCKSCADCPFKPKCTSNKTGRTLNRLEHEASLDRQKKKQKLEENRVKLRKRKAIVERIFSYIKEILGFRRWTVRGLEKVKTEWKLACSAYNLATLHKLFLKNGLSYELI